MTTLGKDDAVLDLRGNLPLDRSEVGIMQCPRLAHPQRETIDRIALLPVLNLRPVAIELRVEHRMRAKAISPAFEECGPATTADRRAGAPCCGLDGDDIHAVDDLRRDIVALRLDVDVGLRFRSLEPCP